jgi:hypothetical protein
VGSFIFVVDYIVITATKIDSSSVVLIVHVLVAIKVRENKIMANIFSVLVSSDLYCHPADGILDSNAFLAIWSEIK